jgi:predicted RNase H-like nuclease (RuvC/YqgF family)
MAIKTTNKREESGDLLGLVTFGSIVANIWQIVSKHSLEQEHNALKVDAEKLRIQYNEIVKNYRMVYDEYIAMKRTNESLSAEISALNGIIITLREENKKLSEELKDYKSKD